jgi:glutamyl-tRNA synthetase
MREFAATYRGRLAPSPTGLLHLGHARTFWTAYRRAIAANGVLILRNEDLDPQRSRVEFATAMIEDLTWLGIRWQEGPVADGNGERGAFAPYTQSLRRPLYLEAWRKLRDSGSIYPCTCSRKDVARAAQAPHEGDAAGHPAEMADDEEPLYPSTCRNQQPSACTYAEPAGVNWRFRVPDGDAIEFVDQHYSAQRYVAGSDFGDFLIWRRDGVPAYQLAVVVDDAAMRITEVVRGADLLKSTARQILLQRTLGLSQPHWYHCDLMLDEHGIRYAKQQDALSLRHLRALGETPEEIHARF